MTGGPARSGRCLRGRPSGRSPPPARGAVGRPAPGPGSRPRPVHAVAGISDWADHHRGRRLEDDLGWAHGVGDGQCSAWSPNRGGTGPLRRCRRGDGRGRRRDVPGWDPARPAYDALGRRAAGALGASALVVPHASSVLVDGTSASLTVGRALATVAGAAARGRPARSPALDRRPRRRRSARRPRGVRPPGPRRTHDHDRRRPRPCRPARRRRARPGAALALVCALVVLLRARVRSAPAP